MKQPHHRRVPLLRGFTSSPLSEVSPLLLLMLREGRGALCDRKEKKTGGFYQKSYSFRKKNKGGGGMGQRLNVKQENISI